MIASPHNEKLKLVRKLRERKHRDREQAFVTEGEDLVAAGLAAGVEPRFVLVAADVEPRLVTAAEHPAAEKVEPRLLAEASNLGSGSRVIAVWPQRWATSVGSPCLYLHGIGDPGNVGTIVRTAHALLEGSIVLGPSCADPFSPKAVRASMGSIFSQPLARGEVGETPAPRAALVAHGGMALSHGEGAAALREAATLCLGAERAGLPAELLSACACELTIPLRKGGPESLNVAAVAAIVCERISSLAMPEAQSDA